MKKFKGFVKKLNVKEGRGKRGPWKAYSAKIEGEDGREYDEWVSLGFDAPPFKEGDFVTLETEEQDGRQQYIKGSAKVQKNSPARSGSSTGSRGESNSASASASGPSNAERQNSITYQSSRKDAIEVVALLLEHKALPITGAQTKAGEAKRFAEITAAVDKMTVEFFNDVNTLRVLTEVADAGAVSKKKDTLPDDSEEEESEEAGDDEPEYAEDDE